MFNKFNSLRNSMLVAMPTPIQEEQDYFAEAVILICEHDEKGAMGLVINRPLDINVAEVLQQMRIVNNNNSLRQIPVLSGGPVKSDKGFILHFNELIPQSNKAQDINLMTEWRSSMILNEHLAITTSDDIIHALANNTHPSPFIFALGYCEWSAGQLENELKENSWLCAPFDLDILFNIPHLRRWRECTYNIGIDNIHNLSTYIGHA